MKYIITAYLIFFPFILKAQEVNKNAILNSYKNGSYVKDFIDDSMYSKLTTWFSNNEELEIIMQRNKNADKSYNIYTDLYYCHKNQCFLFTLIKGKHIPDDTEWGLFDYLFVIEIQMDLENQKYKSVKFVNDSEMKMWWQSLMDSYRNKANKRQEWAEKYNLVPPPPLPPQKKEWMY